MHPSLAIISPTASAHKPETQTATVPTTDPYLLPTCLFVRFGVAFGNLKVYHIPGSSHVGRSNNQLHRTPQSGQLSSCRISIIAPYLRCRFTKMEFSLIA
jgi:hypothetical protein